MYRYMFYSLPTTDIMPYGLYENTFLCGCVYICLGQPTKLPNPREHITLHVYVYMYQTNMFLNSQADQFVFIML